MSKDWPDQQNNNSKNGQKSASVLLHQQSSFSGPLPPPEILKKFDELVPGSAERIIKMAEGQFAHRTELERQVISSDIQRSKWGQILGFVVAIVGLLSSVIVSIYGGQIAGSVLGGGTLVSLVSVFVYGTKSRNKERLDKEVGDKK